MCIKSEATGEQSIKDNPIAVILVLAVWPGEAYEIDFHKESSIPRKTRNCPGA